MWEGFLYICVSPQKFRIDFGTHSLTIPVNSQIKSESYPYIPALIGTGKGHAQSISFRQEKSESTTGDSEKVSDSGNS